MSARTPLVLLCLLVLATVPCAAQDTVIVIHPDSVRPDARRPVLPRAVADEVITFHNARTTARLVGRTRLPRGNEWRGDVAVRNGPVVVAGRIDGSLVVVNGDVVLEAGGEITGMLLVVGGAVDSTGAARVGGGVRVFHERLRYRPEGDEIVYAPDAPRLPPFEVERSWETGAWRSSLLLATGGTFNRVEGLPIVFGPRLERRVWGDGRLRFDALGVFRTAGDVGGSSSDLGYRLRAEVRSGERRGGGLRLRAFDVVAPVEDWGLYANEVGWASFLFRRDYRDYYFTDGLAGTVFVRPTPPLELALEIGYEDQTSTPARDPWSLLRNDDDWRPNPPIDAGHYTTALVTADFDTRNDRITPTAGWWLQGAIEYGRAPDVSPQTGVPASVRPPLPTDGSYHYWRAFLDLRRYTRLSASGRVNARMVLGGWLGGDALPLQRRLSLGGPDLMPGYSFRESACNEDIIDPAFTDSQVAACDRVLVFQAEYRGHIRLNWSYNPSRDSDESVEGGRSRLLLEGMDVIVFGNAGQAWLVGEGPGRIPSNRLPTIGSWIADLGLGVAWGGFGLYLSKAVTDEPLRFTMRLEHRF
jgi:hypothetical protein